MKLRIEDKDRYLEQVYAAWLGKVIGVRLGSPVENWSHEKIMEAFPDEEGYLVDYDVYAADDDLNGPLFFVRALLEEGELSAEKIGDTFLNYLQEYRGFFWWGGVGVSSEHTAYENLKKGIPAPKSGSAEVNGLTMAEQIGGQIFSDCWGYVAGYDPDLAKRMAQMASSVTHDRNGIQGGIFVAVAITLAMMKEDIHEVIDEALEYLDKDMEYYQTARDIIRFYEENRNDWTLCLKYIQDNYGYDRYPGVCHIIPNMALMIMAMCYGENDFDRTLVMLNRCGWDTDCNCGNVGSIMGALKGLDGIDEKWIRPIGDIVNASSAIGFLNIQTVSDSASLFAKLAYRLQGMEVEYDPFELPYALKGLRSDEGRMEVRDRKLHVDACDIYKYVYYLADDLYDARYDPQFSPVVSSGDEIIFDVEADEDTTFITYVRDCDGKESLRRQKDAKHLHLLIPCGPNYTANRIGIRADRPYSIRDMRVIRKPKLDYLFADLATDHYGPRYGGDYMNNVRAFVEHSGNWKIAEGLVGESGEHGLISSGAYGDRYRKMEWEMIAEKGEEHLLVFSMRGYLDHYALGLRKDRLVLIRKKVREELLCSYEIEWKKGVRYRLTVEEKEKMLEVTFDGERYYFPHVDLRDLYGFRIGKESLNRTLRLVIDQ